MPAKKTAKKQTAAQKKKAAANKKKKAAASKKRALTGKGGTGTTRIKSDIEAVGILQNNIIATSKALASVMSTEERAGLVKSLNMYNGMLYNLTVQLYGRYRTAVENPEAKPAPKPRPQLQADPPTAASQPPLPTPQPPGATPLPSPVPPGTTPAPQ